MTCDGTEQHSVAGAEAWHMAWHGAALHIATLQHAIMRCMHAAAAEPG